LSVALVEPAQAVVLLDLPAGVANTTPAVVKLGAAAVFADGGVARMWMWSSAWRTADALVAGEAADRGLHHLHALHGGFSGGAVEDGSLGGSVSGSCSAPAFWLGAGEAATTTP
jgi:hypothetical protein